MILRRELQAVLNELRGAPIMDPVWGPIRAFAATARSQLESVDKRIGKASAAYDQLVDFFAEDPDLKNDEFFSILLQKLRSHQVQSRPCRASDPYWTANKIFFLFYRMAEQTERPLDGSHQDRDH